MKRAESDLIEEPAHLFDAHAADGAQVFAVLGAADSYPIGFLAEPPALAFRAQRIAAVAAEEDAHVQLVFLAVEIGEETFQAHPGAPPPLALGAAVPNEFLFLLRQFEIRDVEPHAVLARHFLELVIEVPVARLGPRTHRAFVERARRVGDHQIGIEINGVAEAVAARAGAVGAVEGKQARLRLNVGDAAVLALEPLVEGEPLRQRAGLRIVRAPSGRRRIGGIRNSTTASPPSR